MKPFFKQLRESAAQVAEAWGNANFFEVDLDAPEILAFQDFRGIVSFLAIAYGGHVTQCNVSYELKEDGFMHVFAQGATSVKFDMAPYHAAHEARLWDARENSQARHVADAVFENYKRDIAEGRSLVKDPPWKAS